MKFILDREGVLQIFPEYERTVGSRVINQIDDIKTGRSFLGNLFREGKELEPKIHFVKGEAENSSNGYLDLEYDGQCLADSSKINLRISKRRLEEIDLLGGGRDFIADNIKGHRVEVYATYADKNPFK